MNASTEGYGDDLNESIAAEEEAKGKEALLQTIWESRAREADAAHQEARAAWDKLTAAKAATKAAADARSAAWDRERLRR